MILKRLKLTNIRSYTSGQIEFPEGSTLLSGDIGSGKSTILLATEFALFGIQRGTLSGESLLRNGCSEGAVELTMDIDGKQYTIKRTLKRSSGSVVQKSGHIIAGDTKWEGTPVELKSRILEILGYPKELLTRSKTLLFRYTVYTPQEEMKTIISEDADSRLDTLRKVFDVDKYRRMRENISIYTRELRSRIRELRARCEGHEEKSAQFREREHEKKELEIRLRETASKLDPLKKRMDALRKDIGSKEKAAKQVADLKSKAETAKSRMSDLSARIAQAQSDISEIGSSISKISSKISSIDVPAKIETEGVESRIAKKEAAISRFDRSMISVKEKLRAVQDDIARLDKDIERSSRSSEEMILLKQKREQLSEKAAGRQEIRKRMDETRSGYEQVISELSSCQSRMKESSKLMDDVKGLEKCPTCLQYVDEDHKKSITRKEKERIEKLKNRCDELSKKNSALEKTLADLRKEQESMISAENELGVIDERIRMLAKESDQALERHKERAEIEEKKKRLEKEKQRLEEIGIEEARDELEDLKKKLSMMNEQKLKVKEKKGLEDLLSEKKKIADKTEELKYQLEKQKAETQEQLSKIAERIASFGDVEKQLGEMRSSLDRIRDEKTDLDVMSASLSKEIESVQKQIADLEKDLSRIEEHKKRMKKLAGYENWLQNFFIGLTVTIEKHVMLAIQREFTAYFEGWFNTLVEDETLAARLSDDFSPVIEQNGYETGVQDLSGGEKTSVALAYRLSLNKVINDMVSGIRTKDLIILDEPTDGFSTEQLDRVRLVIEELDNRQLIIVSHEEKIESFVQNIIRISKREHVSEVA